MTWRTWLIKKIDPEMVRDAERYYWLRSEIDDAHRWLGEFSKVEMILNWLRERDADHWRALDEKPIGKLPTQIYNLREIMRRDAVQ